MLDQPSNITPALPQCCDKVCIDSCIRLPEASIKERVRLNTGLLRLEAELRYHNDQESRRQKHVVGIFAADQQPSSQRAPLLKGRPTARRLSALEQTAITKLLIQELESEEREQLQQ